MPTNKQRGILARMVLEAVVSKSQNDPVLETALRGALNEGEDTFMAFCARTPGLRGEKLWEAFNKHKVAAFQRGAKEYTFNEFVKEVSLEPLHFRE